MSAGTSRNSPTSASSCGDVLDRGERWRSPSARERSASRSPVDSAFDGAEELLRSWADGLTPDAAETVSAWADRHRVLSSRASAEPGRYRTDRTPYLRAVMDALSPGDPCRRVVLMKAAQVGATEAGNN